MEIPADHYVCHVCKILVPYGEKCLHNGTTIPVEPPYEGNDETQSDSCWPDD